MKRAIRFVPAALLGAVLSTSATAAEFIGLGHLRDYDFSSEMAAISADGTVVLGRSASSTTGESFRWTRGGAW